MFQWLGAERSLLRDLDEGDVHGVGEGLLGRNVSAIVVGIVGDRVVVVATEPVAPDIRAWNRETSPAMPTAPSGYGHVALTSESSADELYGGEQVGVSGHDDAQVVGTIDRHGYEVYGQGSVDSLFLRSFGGPPSGIPECTMNDCYAIS